ncbi:MAG: hypothetical protein E6K80_03290 [Candidatus Eisenbacteria bacterium]|uniref:Uncharacterized protein n=1 Tax=Eiseniibacteriota bacterium TaxID=2212470 RepID=A0A538U8L6_UNCEI|nr:MAG: hypothetical protein E6K80_03290 [Candidatus Eisenbacteria bacterium]
MALIYGQTARHAFVTYDDIGYFVQNPHVAAGLTWEGIGWAFTHAYAANWHPLTWVSHMLDCQLFGVGDRSAGAHHLVSAGIHAVNAVLLYQLLGSTTGARWTSAWVALAFAVHPLRVESVAWASERKDVLSGFFFFLTLRAYAWHVARPSAARMA